MSKWKMVRLGEVCCTTQGVQIPLSEQIDCEKEGYIQYLYIGDFKGTNRKLYVENKYLQKVVSCEDLVMANTGSPGAVFKGMRGILSNNLFKITFNKDLLCLEFLYLYLSSHIFQSMLQKKMKGGIQQHLGHKTIAEQLVPLPPLEEQKRIADILDKAGNLIDLRKQQLEKMDLLIKSKFIDMFGEYLIKNINSKRLPEVTEFIDYRGRTPEKSNKGIPLITAKNVKDNAFSVEPQEFIPEENYNEVMTRGIPKINDVLFTTEAPLGNVCRIPNIFGKFCVGQRLITMQPVNGLVTSEFLEYVLLSKEFKDEMWKKSSGSTVKGIRSKELAKLTIPVPPIELQNDFAAFVEQVEKQKAVMQQSLEKMETNYKALMQEYFG